MKRTILILAVLCAGCNSAASQTADETDATAPGYTARERQLIEMCNEIAVEREILAAKYNALIEAHSLDMRPEPLTVKRCT
jgi:hypothetical protein